MTLAQFAAQLMSGFHEAYITPFQPKKDSRGRRSFSGDLNFEVPDVLQMIFLSLYSLSAYGRSVTQDVNTWLATLPSSPDAPALKPFDFDATFLFGIEEDMVQLAANCICNTVMLKSLDVAHPLDEPRGLQKFLSPSDAPAHKAVGETNVIQKLCDYAKENLEKLIQAIQCKTEFTEDQPRLVSIVRPPPPFSLFPLCLATNHFSAANRR